MPIRPEMKARYPKNWKDISKARREAAGNRCEGSPAYPDCRAENGKPHPVTGSTVVLTVAHLDHKPENCSAENLRAWCQRCHNTYDAPMRAAGRRARAAAAVPHPETAAVFREFMAATGIGVFEYARLIGMHRDTISKRSRGAIGMPTEANELLAALTMSARRGVNVKKMLERRARARSKE